MDSDYLKKNVTTSNISYLIQYGLIPKIRTKWQSYKLTNEIYSKYYESYVGKGSLHGKTNLEMI